MNIKHIFFDLDHTLWDFDKNSQLTFKELFKEYNIQILLQVFLKAYKPINLNYWRLYREDKISKPKLRFCRLKDTFDALNYNISDELINKLSEEYINRLPNYNHLIDGALTLLDYLKPKYKLHIITNGFEEVQNLKLVKSKIKKYFNTIITSESVGAKKPNPKVFAFALEQSSAFKRESVMIGDSIEADVMGALHFGMLAIHCNFSNEYINKNIVSVKSLLQIKNYL